MSVYSTAFSSPFLMCCTTPFINGSTIGGILTRTPEWVISRNPKPSVKSTSGEPARAQRGPLQTQARQGVDLRKPPSLARAGQSHAGTVTKAAPDEHRAQKLAAHRMRSKAPSAGSTPSAKARAGCLPQPRAGPGDDVPPALEGSTGDERLLMHSTCGAEARILRNHAGATTFLRTGGGYSRLGRAGHVPTIHPGN